MPPPMAATGDLARYRYISTIGSGGMARVDLAEDTLLGRQVALKRMAGPADDRGLSRLHREALAGASLSHPNLVAIYDVVTSDEGQLVIVMEYIAGGTLREALNKSHRLPPDEALRVLDGVAAGLDAIHQRGIIHRDVKPSNILLGEAGAVKVADLGIAAIPDRTRITTVGSVVGSLSYMAPEQLDNSPSTPAIDVYALAALAYEALSGEKARRETNPVTLAHAIATQEPPDLRNVWPDAPPGAADLLRRGMSRDPADRPRTGGELVGGLRTALAPGNGAGAGQVAADEAATEPQTRRHRVAAAAVPLGAAANRLPPARTGPARRQPPGGSRPAGSGSGPPGPGGPGSRPPGRGRNGDRPAPGHLSDERRRSRVAPLLAALLAVAAALVVLAVLLNQGGSAPARRASAHHHHAAAASQAKSTSSSTPSTTATHSAAPAPAPSASSTTSATTAASSSTTSHSTPAPAAAPPPAGSPASAVEAFYGAAAAHHYPAAWALADPTLRAQLEGYRNFEAGQAGDRSITFNSARVTSQSSRAATVAIQTTSVRNDGTSHCAGTVDLVPVGGQWRLHLVNINCHR